MMQSKSYQVKRSQRNGGASKVEHHSPRRQRKRVVRNDHPTNELVLSAHVDGNDCVFPKILQLYVRPGSVIADTTYGKGVFWRNVRPGAYKLLATDIQDGVDCRNLPYMDSELDC